MTNGNCFFKSAGVHPRVGMFVRLQQEQDPVPSNGWSRKKFDLKPFSVYQALKHGNIGVTMEENGLRARFEIER
jgi:hypothetical protein